jgi:hypothetical protein
VVLVSVFDPGLWVLVSVLDPGLIDYLLSHLRLFHLHVYGDITIASEGLQNLGLCSELKAHLNCFDTGPPFFWFHPKDSFDTQGYDEDLF